MPGPRRFQPIELASPPRTVGSPSAGLPVVQATPAATVSADPSTTPAPPAKFDRPKLKDSWTQLTGRTMQWLLQGDRLEAMLAEQKLKDIGILLGIGTEKVLLLEGQPTQIISQHEQKKLDEVLPALLTEIKRRGVRAELTERKVELQVPAGNV